MQEYVQPNIRKTEAFKRIQPFLLWFSFLQYIWNSKELLKFKNAVEYS